MYATGAPSVGCVARLFHALNVVCHRGKGAIHTLAKVGKGDAPILLQRVMDTPAHGVTRLGVIDGQCPRFPSHTNHI